MSCRPLPWQGRLKARISRRIWKRNRALFLLSTGRAGTTSSIGLLQLSSQIAAYHEPEPLFLQESLDAYRNFDATAERSRYLFKRTRAGGIANAWYHGKAYAEASYMTAWMPLIAEMLPNASFALLVRHPGDVVRSWMRRGAFTGEHSWDRYRLYPLPDSRYSEEWRKWSSFERACWAWGEINHIILSHAECLSDSRFSVVRFEELVDPKTRAYERLFGAVNAEPVSHERAVEYLSQPVNEQQSGDFPKYKDWSNQQRGFLREVAGEVAVLLDYEL